MLGLQSPSHPLTNGVEEEDDPVVERIPVFLSRPSKESESQLFLFEYNQTATINELGGDKIIKSRIKPKSQKIELHLKLDVESSNFNRDLAQKLASAAPKTSVDPSRNIVETQVMTSTAAVPQDPERFAVAVSREDGIHINPLSGIILLKPTFSYLDASSRKREPKEAASNPAPTLQAAQPVSVKFARQSAKQLKAAQATASQQKMQEEEPWCDTEFFDTSHFQSEREKDKLFCEQTHQDISDCFSVTAEAYLPALCPPEPERKPDDDKDDEEKSRKKDAIMTAVEISKLPLNGQIKERLKQLHLTRFSRLKQLLGSPYPDQDILKGLGLVADLVKGNWVLKSSLCYDKDFSSIKGTTGERMAAARDKILQFYKTNEIAVCEKLFKLTNIPHDDIKEILRKIAKHKPGEGWKFKLEKDTEFIESFPDCVESHHALFEMRIRNREKKEEELAADAKLALKKARIQSGRQRKNSTRSRKDSQCSDYGW